MVSTITNARSRSLSLWTQRRRQQIGQLVRWVPVVGLSALLTVSSAQVDAETYKLNFKDAEVQELIKFVADATGLTFVVDPKVRGKIKVISTEAVDEKQLYDLFLSILEIHGFAAVRQGNVVRVVPDRTARSMPVPVSPAASKQAARAGGAWPRGSARSSAAASAPGGPGRRTQRTPPSSPSCRPSRST